MTTLLAQRTSARYYDHWEEASPDERRRVIAERLAEYVSFAQERVPWYRDRLAQFDPQADHPLCRVPVMTSTELRERVPPAGDGLVVPTEQGVTVFQSGGTTGLPKTALFSQAELDGLDLPNARGFFALGLVPEDRVANLFAVGGLYMTFIHINRMLQQYGCRNFPFANHTPPEFVHTVARLFRVNCFTGITSVVLDCLRKMIPLGTEGLTIEKVYFGGEHIYEADRRELKEKLGVKQIAAPGYGTVDTWYLGYQCRECPPGVFHVHDDQAYLEIVDPENGEPSAPGATGMLYATPFPRRLTPVIRYQVGDRGLWLKDACACGRTTPLFSLLGRGDEVLRVGYDSVDYRFVQDEASGIPGLSGVIQMEKQRCEGRDRLVIRVETGVPEAERGALARRLETRILERRPSLREFVKKGTIWPLGIEVVAPGTLPRNPRTGKLIRVVDAL